MTQIVERPKGSKNKETKHAEIRNKKRKAHNKIYEGNGGKYIQTDEKNEQKYDKTNRANEEKMERRKIGDGEKKKKIRIKRNTI